MTVSGKIVVADGEPLRNAYVRHADTPWSGERTYRTDDEGWVDVDSDGNWFTREVEVRVFAQNPVVRMLDGTTIPVPFQVSQTMRFENGQTVRIPAQREHFRIANRFHRLFERGLGDFTPWRGTPLSADMDGLPRIEVSFPDQMVQPLSFVEPRSLATGDPLLHLKRPGNGGTPDADTLSHELAHALHFSKLSEEKRTEIQDTYLAWLVEQVIQGEEPFHSFGRQTSPMVAFIEAFGHFAEQYTDEGTLSASERRQRFFDNALGPGQESVRGADVEGAVYAALFVDYAQAVASNGSVGGDGLDWVITRYVESEATTVVEFAHHVRREYGRDSREFRLLVASLARWGITHPSFELSGRVLERLSGLLNGAGRVIALRRPRIPT